MTAGLTPRRAKALIARRLAALGQPKDYIAAAAIDELFARSHETESGLLAALSATLFLASTEDAERVEASHVRAAVPDSEPIRLRISARRRGSMAWLAGCAAAVSCLAAIALFMLTPPRGPAAAGKSRQIVQMATPEASPPKMKPLPAAQPPAPASARAGATGRTPAGHTAAPVPAKPAGQAAVAAATPPPLDNVLVRSPPVPPELDAVPPKPPAKARVQAPAAGSLALPEAPPPQLTLVVPATDRLEQNRLGGLAERFQRAGVTQIRLEKIDFSAHLARPIPRNRVFYFFRKDLGLARRMAALLDMADADDAARNPWVPYLVLAPAGVVPHPPGSIEAYIP